MVVIKLAAPIIVQPGSVLHLAGVILDASDLPAGSVALEVRNG